MPQMKKCATEVSSQAGGSEGRRKRKPSSLTQWERGSSFFSWAALAGADNKLVQTVLPRNNLTITSSQCFVISYTTFAGTGTSIALKGSMTAWQAGNVLFASLLLVAPWLLVAPPQSIMTFSFFKAKGEAVCALGTENIEQQEFSRRAKYISNKTHAK